MPKPVENHSRYMSGIDGLRAIAVFAVILYHLNVGFAQGGLLGVGVFFVLSGYLITDILVNQWKQYGNLRLADFWARRARRLLPALLVMLIAVSVFMLITQSTELLSIRGDFIAALLYVSNWWYIFHHVSYFASFGPPSPLSHLWSLAVEEQFYLIWPFLLLLGLKFIRRKGWLILLTLLLATASAVAMAVLYHPGLDPTRVYDGTDTRAFALLIGASLAFMWPSRKLSPTLSAKARIVLDSVGTIGLVSILYMMWQTNEYETFLYRGGLVVVSIATAMIIIALAHPASRLAKVLGCAPLRWLGVRSYAIYLWHYPVIVLTSRSVDTTGVDIPRAILQVAVSVLLAAFSWKFIEDPIRRGAITRIIQAMKKPRGKHTFPRRRLRFRGLVSLGALLVTGGCGVGTVESTSAAVTPTHTSGNSIHTSSTGVSTPQKTKVPVSEVAPNIEKNVSRHPTTSSNVATTPSTKVPGVKSTTSTQTGLGISVMGDSVMVDAKPYLQKDLPGIVVSAEVGRQWYQLPATIAALKSSGQLGSRVIIETGTNGPFTAQQLGTILQSLGSVKQIVLVNTRVPRPWQNIVNSTITQVAAKFPNATVADWYTASTGKDNYFYPDGVHLDPTGAAAYARFLIDSLQRGANQPIATSSGT